ncbi:winged helix-turn-helix transcriptional regulator [Iningainema tapete]|uniref:Helix-turn-helix transcriptional regulator n=1 Tax=Iningainema tapete BLCC-T55 TaxID=2748662 RepID=A0A8J6XG49_9CYAN|nr:helix-turn-helix domain-containing protein [Iningainema tapete]MBD2771034.1 helix-turn-helix transcriptional regulator [Iningainema tapete BLCC-T55]
MSVSQESGSCPVGTLLNLLGGPWTFYILWILRNNGPTRFGAIKRQMEGISSKVLTERLRMLEEAEIVYRSYKPSIPPQVTYGLTERSQDLIVVLDQLAAIAHKWYPQEKYSQVAPENETVVLDFATNRE